MPRILGPRECFIPRQGRRNWHSDYDQMEMRFFVHFTKDPKMAAAIEEDIHLHVASEIYALPLDQVSKEQRKRAKGVNFGILFGSGPDTMAETLTKKGLLTTVREATKLVVKYHQRFPSLRRIMNKLKQQLFRLGYVTNTAGRRYYVDPEFSYRCLNYLCQGSAADLMKKAMVKIWEYIRSHNLKSRLLMTVHDELVVEMPRNEEKIMVPKMIELMQDLTSFYIPMTVDVEVVDKRWSEKRKPADLGLEHLIKKGAA